MLPIIVKVVMGFEGLKNDEKILIFGFGLQTRFVSKDGYRKFTESVPTENENYGDEENDSENSTNDENYGNRNSNKSYFRSAFFNAYRINGEWAELFIVHEELKAKFVICDEIESPTCQDLINVYLKCPKNPPLQAHPGRIYTDWLEADEDTHPIFTPTPNQPFINPEQYRLPSLKKNLLPNQVHEEAAFRPSRHKYSDKNMRKSLPMRKELQSVVEMRKKSNSYIDLVSADNSNSDSSSSTSVSELKIDRRPDNQTAIKRNVSLMGAKSISIVNKRGSGGNSDGLTDTLCNVIENSGTNDSIQQIEDKKDIANRFLPTPIGKIYGRQPLRNRVAQNKVIKNKQGKATWKFSKNGMLETLRSKDEGYVTINRIQHQEKKKIEKEKARMHLPFMNVNKWHDCLRWISSDAIFESIDNEPIVTLKIFDKSLGCCNTRIDEGYDTRDRIQQREEKNLVKEQAKRPLPSMIVNKKNGLPLWKY